MSVAKYFSPKLRALILHDEEPLWLQRHPRRQYIVSCVLGSVPWADKRELDVLRRWCRVLETFTGERHVLDHVIPLNHPAVCGLNVPANLRCVPWRVNAAKGNAWHPDQLELLL